MKRSRAETFAIVELDAYLISNCVMAPPDIVTRSAQNLVTLDQRK